VTATISHLVLPVSLAGTLRERVAAARTQLADYTAALLGRRRPGGLPGELLAETIAIEKLRASAAFEDREIRDRGAALQRLDAAVLRVIDLAPLLARSLQAIRRDGTVVAAMDRALGSAAAAIVAWRSGEVDAGGLRRCFVRATAALPLARSFYGDALAADDEAVHGAAAVGRVRDLLAEFAACRSPVPGHQHDPDAPAIHAVHSLALSGAGKERGPRGATPRRGARRRNPACRRLESWRRV
jgi:hypothetical protein